MYLSLENSFSKYDLVPYINKKLIKISKLPKLKNDTNFLGEITISGKKIKLIHANNPPKDKRTKNNL